MTYLEQLRKTDEFAEFEKVDVSNNVVTSYTVFLHCKNVRISTDILWRVFRILTGPVSHTFVSVNRRNVEARAHIAQHCQCLCEVVEKYCRSTIRCSISIGLID